MSPTDDDANECATKNPPVNTATPSNNVANHGVAVRARPAMPAAIAGAIDGGPQGRSEELAELRVEVNKVGVNLNQLTRAFNRGQVQGRTFSEHEALMMALGETAAAMREVRDLLGGAR